MSESTSNISMFRSRFAATAHTAMMTGISTVGYARSQNSSAFWKFPDATSLALSLFGFCLRNILDGSIPEDGASWFSIILLQGL